MEQLKPCPFCGDEMIDGEFGFDHPENDDCIIGFGSFANYYRAAWNTRTPSRNDVLEEAGDMAEVTDVVERVARAIYSERSAAEPGLAAHLWETENAETRDWYFALARTALAAMLEAVGEPVAMMMQHAEFERIELEEHSTGRTYLTDGDRKAGWTETPLYSLAALREEL